MATPPAALFAFIAELDRLKAVLRKSRPTGLDRQENSAEHSWHVAVLALSLADACAFPVDAGHAAKLLLIHDIPEIDAGDRIVYDQSNVAEHAARELAGARRIFGLLAEPLAGELLALWQEFEAGETPEARYARAIDRMTPVLQNLSHNGLAWRENRIRTAQIVTMNEPKISPVFPQLWPEILQKLDALTPRLPD